MSRRNLQQLQGTRRISRTGILFDEDSFEIVTLATKEVISESIAQYIMYAHEEGRKQLSVFVKVCLESQVVAFHQSIK